MQDPLHAARLEEEARQGREGAPGGRAPPEILGGTSDVPKPKRSGSVKKIDPFSKRKRPL